jgi:hypothetical protein
MVESCLDSYVHRQILEVSSLSLLLSTVCLSNKGPVCWATRPNGILTHTILPDMGHTSVLFWLYKREWKKRDLYRTGWELKNEKRRLRSRNQATPPHPSTQITCHCRRLPLKNNCYENWRKLIFVDHWVGGWVVGSIGDQDDCLL